jgi:predicted RNA-binding Zn-ribbon protein involved in translation (DUF1610 family)
VSASPADVVGFLTACLDEDERVARQGMVGRSPEREDLGDYDPDVWAAHDQRCADWDASWHTHKCGWRTGEGLDDKCGCGVPARVLADVEVKKRLLDVHAEGQVVRLNPATAPSFSMTIGDLAPDPILLSKSGETVDVCQECGRAWPCDTVRLLAHPYRDRPGFDPAWTVVPPQ